MRPGTWIAGLALVLFLAGCAIFDTPPAERLHRTTSGNFSLEGRISVKKEGQSYAGNISWRHQEEQDEILLSTPLGQGLASLVGDKTQARLELADKRSYTAPDMEALSAQIFGAPLPLRHLPLWVLGRSGSDGQLKRDARGRPARLMAQAWQIDYLAFEDEADDALPTRLFLQRGELEIRLAIDAWTQEKP